MRKINPGDFTIATRSTSREINRQIALTLIGAHQPVSRADLARQMNTNRANVTFLINELLEEGLVREGATGVEAKRGRKPTFLFLNSQEQRAVAVDVRATRTFLMMTDRLGKQLTEIISFPTELKPDEFVRVLSSQIRLLLGSEGTAVCDGIGVVFPGMVDRKSGVVVHAPTLGWRDVNLLAPLAAEFPDVPVYIENSGKACALSQIWTTRGADIHALNDLVFVSVSDGVGVGVVINGELLRGRHNTAGEFGHVPLSIDGPLCSCGATGCWEAYISNLATLARYFGQNAAARGKAKALETNNFTINDLIQKARGGDGKALGALHSTARYLGLGLASIVNAIDPSRVFIGGEITEAWDLIEPVVRTALAERVLTKAGAETPIRIVPAIEHPRLRGAVALVTAPAFAAPSVA